MSAAPAEGGVAADAVRPIALVSMPWMAVDFPSIQLATAAAVLADAGLHCDVHELFLDYAATIGPKLYARLADSGGFNEEWLFADDYFSAEAGIDLSPFLDRFPSFGLGERSLEETVLRALRPVTADFLDRMADATDWGRYDIVGFSLTIAQTCASIALARRLKKRHPHLVLIAGGSSCAGPMGPALLAMCPYLDVIVQAEAEAVLVELVARLRAGAPLDGMPGIVHRMADGAVAAGPPAGLVAAPRRSQALQFDAYFARLERLGLSSQVTPWLPFESSRGCWYGEKNQCTFCGLHEIMRYRSRPALMVLDDLERLVARHDVPRLFSVDLIMPQSYYEEFLPEVVRRKHDWTFFYEIKANVRREQVETLARSGVTWIQPGIESLHDTSLELMRKGVCAAHNVQLLKWCRELGIQVTWNMILGIPGETEDVYAEMAALIPLLHGLPPPSGLSQFQLHRFSPLFEASEAFGIRRLGAHKLFQFIYPIDPALRDDLVYNHEYVRLDGATAPRSAALAEAVSDWQAAFHAGARLTLARAPDGEAEIVDRRTARPQTITLTPAQASLYGFLDAATPDVSLVASFEAAAPKAAAELGGARGVVCALENWLEAGLVLRTSGRTLALAVADPPMAAAL